MAESVKIPDDLHTDACREADLNNRSVASQIAHWLLIGRAAEATDDFEYARVIEALEGKRDTTQLSELEAAVWLDAFTNKMGQPSAAEMAYYAERKHRQRGN